MQLSEREPSSVHAIVLLLGDSRAIQLVLFNDKVVSMITTQNNTTDLFCNHINVYLLQQSQSLAESYPGTPNLKKLQMAEPLRCLARDGRLKKISLVLG